MVFLVHRLIEHLVFLVSANWHLFFGIGSNHQLGVNSRVSFAAVHFLYRQKTSMQHSIIAVFCYFLLNTLIWHEIHELVFWVFFWYRLKTSIWHDIRELLFLCVFSHAAAGAFLLRSRCIHPKPYNKKSSFSSGSRFLIFQRTRESLFLIS